MDTAQSSFTWKHWLGLTSMALGIMAGCCYAGFVAGQRFATAEALTEQVNLQNLNSQLQAQLAIARLPVTASGTAATTIPHAEFIEMPPELAEEERTLANQAHNLDIVRGGSCANIHQQIQHIKKELQGSGSNIVYDANPSWQEEQKYRRSHLEQRLVDYQQRLDYCE